MSADVDICNQALGAVGAQTIVSLDEASAGAVACKRLFPLARDALLALHDWRFASARQALALLDEQPPANWQLVYALPSDCLRARTLESPLAGPGAGPAGRFERRGDRIVTDLAEAVLIYTRRVHHAGEFTPLFADSLAALLAIRLGAALRVDPDLVQLARQDYQLTLGQARAADANEASNRDQPEADWIEARS